MGFNSVYFGYIGGGGGSSPGAGIVFNKLPFEIGQPGSPMNDGDTVLVITVANPITDSEDVYLDSQFVEPDLSNQISYTVIYTTSNITITFNQGVVNGQKYYIKYVTTI